MSNNVIAIFGKARAGKNAVGDIVASSRRDVIQMAFADRLKSMCVELFGLTREDVDTDEGKKRPTKLLCPTCPVCRSIDTRLVRPEVAFSSFYDQPVVNSKGPVKVECRSCGALGPEESFAGWWTPRTIMQYFATEGVRRIDPKAWARLAMRNAAEVLSPSLVRKAGCPVPQLVVITDGRFQSELDAVREAGGRAWRLLRPSTDGESVGIAGHQSETELDRIPHSAFDSVIVNDGSLQDLARSVHEALG